MPSRSLQQLPACSAALPQLEPLAACAPQVLSFPLSKARVLICLLDVGNDCLVFAVLETKCPAHKISEKNECTFLKCGAQEDLRGGF